MQGESVRPDLSIQGNEVLAAGEKGIEGVEGGDDDGEKVGDMEKVDGKVLDARKAEIMRRPYTPTQAEIEEHNATHLPYRAWCPHCVAGRGISGHHSMHQDGKKMGITISLDYCFMTPMEKTQHTCPVLVVFDADLEAIWALPVETKGPMINLRVCLCQCRT